MTNKTLLLLGAKSDIGLAIAHRFAKEGFDIQLAARNSENLRDDSADIKIRYGVNVSSHEFNVLDYDSHEKFISSLPTLPLVAISAIGLLGEQTQSEQDFRKAITIIRTNYEGVVSILDKIANHFQRRGSGTIIGISSVAGDRGRASNYIYGSSKAALTSFLSGLRNRLYLRGVNVLTVKPGYVRTKMTSHLNLPKYLTCNPKLVASEVFKSYKFKKEILYLPLIWFPIMLLLKAIPENIFKRLSL